jgi:protein MpaA
MGGRYNTCISKKLNAIASSQSKLDIIGRVNNYPFYRVFLSDRSESKETVLISAGMHGDEPAGPAAIIHFLERNNSHLFEHFNFLLLPCINSAGFEHNKRENPDGIDINRSFERDDIAEVNIVKEALHGLRFAFTIDFHEDWEATGFYLYENKRDKEWQGPAIINAVKEMGNIDISSAESDIPLYEGGSQVDPAWGKKGFTPYLYHCHTDHVIITETPTAWDIEQRANAHLVALDTLLDLYKK